jgi:hypothetical protein
VSAGELVSGVTLHDGETLPAQVVVIARDGAAPKFTYLGLVASADPQPREVVLHGAPPIALFAWGDAPSDHWAWTLQCFGSLPGDVLDVLAARGVIVPGPVVTRLEVARPIDDRGAGGLDRPLGGVYRLGTDRAMGVSWAYVAWEAAHVAALVGKA